MESLEQIKQRFLDLYHWYTDLRQEKINAFQKIAYEDEATKLHGPLFVPKVKAIAARLGMQPSTLMSIMYSESGLKANAGNAKKGGGLIGFLPSTASEFLKIPIEKLLALNGVDQLDYVELFYQKWKDKGVLNRVKSEEDYYLLTFYPAAVGRPDSFILGSEDSDDHQGKIQRIYRANYNLDVDKDGQISVLDFRTYIRTHRRLSGSAFQQPSQSQNGVNPSPQQPLPQPQAVQPSRGGLQGSVGKGGQNNYADVLLVQQLLNRYKAGLAEDGICGPKTERAIFAFQQKVFAGWRGDGLIEPGRDTWRALTGKRQAVVNQTPAPAPQPSPTPTPIAQDHEPNFVDNLISMFSSDRREKGRIEGAAAQRIFDNGLSLPQQPVGKGCPNQSQDVSFVQKLLGLPETGQYDTKLHEAILEFQGFIGLKQDGIIGRGGKTVLALISYEKTLSDTPNIPPTKGVKIQHPQPGARFFSPFGMRPPIPSLKLGAHLHPGIDCGNGLNSAIYAVADGVVIMAGVNGGYGNCVKIDHGPDAQGKRFISLYAHLNSCAVSVGAKVTQGTKIGAEGSTGLSTATHLHFEIRIGGDSSSNAVDPMPYIKGAKLFPAVVI